MGGYRLLAIGVLLLLPALAVAQERPVRDWALPRGLEVGVRVGAEGEWAMHQEGAAEPLPVGRTLGVGVRASFAAVWWNALVVSANVAKPGGEPLHTSLALGAEFRLPVSQRMMGVVGVGLSRVRHSTGAAFTAASWSGALRLRLLPRLSVEAGVEALEALGDAKDGEGVRWEVDGGPSRVTMGASWAL